MGQNVVRSVPLVSPHINVLTNASASGNTQVVAAPSATARIRVLALATVTTTATTVKFQSATNDITAGFPLSANGGLVLPFNEHGWFQTNPGEALNVNLSGASATGVQLQYIVLPS